MDINDLTNFYKNNYNIIVGYLIGYTHREIYEVEDLVQTIFLIICQNLENKNISIRELKAYAYKCIINEFNRQISKEKSLSEKQRKYLYSSYFEIITCIPDRTTEEKIKWLENKMKKCAPQEINCLKYSMQNYDYNQIAKYLGIKKSSVKTHMKNAYKRLRKYENEYNLIFK